MTQEETVNGFVPIPAAAEQAGYSYSYLQQLAKTGKIETRQFYGRRLVNLQQVLKRKRQMSELGPAKHTPHRYREETVEEAVDNEPHPDS